MNNTPMIALLMSLLMIMAAGCNKEDMDIDQLPPITQEGLNTFGCMINGKVFVPKDGTSQIFVSGRRGLSAGYVSDTTYTYSPGYFSITTINSSVNEGTYIYIYIPSLKIPGEYLIGSSNGQLGIDSPPYPHVFVRANGGVYYSLPDTGKLDISRVDTINAIVSGTFEFSALNRKDYLDTLHVTQGRFDINWSALNND